MGLTWPVVLAVLFGALLHASWNALIKIGDDKPLNTALMHAMALFVGVPVLLVVGLPAPQSWPFIAASAAVHVVYFVSLAGAYRHGELGLTYPIMRGTAPLLVALASGMVFAEPLALGSWLGVAGICAGVLMVGLSRGAFTASHGQALRFSLLNAATIAAYTMIDGMGSRASGNALHYVATLFVLNGLPYFLFVMWRRRHDMQSTLAYMRGRWRLALLGTVASFSSYAIALWAMSHAPIAVVAALRETSVLFAVLIGARWLNEGLGARRTVGALLILGGVVSLRLF